MAEVWPVGWRGDIHIRDEKCINGTPFSYAPL